MAAQVSSIYLLLHNKELPMFNKRVRGLVFCNEILFVSKYSYVCIF